MPYVEATGAKLYFEERGSGYPIIFIHELASDLRGLVGPDLLFLPGLPLHRLQYPRLVRSFCRILLLNIGLVALELFSRQTIEIDRAEFPIL
jgi:hypothetical protein